jgi:succinate dehydrogenase / fumarate reductase flavoprotein subunit
VQFSPISWFSNRFHAPNLREQLQEESMDQRYDVIIVGSGLAGLRAAIEVGQDTRVAVITKVFATRSHSGAAQGGIGAAIGNEEKDSWQWHMFDTVKGSDYLGDQDAIEIMTKDAPRVIYELEHMGVPFNRTAEGRIAQRAFGGHTREYGAAPVKRACYAADRTGRVILDTLWEKCLQRGIDFLHEYHVVSLLVENGRCKGVCAYQLSTGQLHLLYCKALLLATGGAGKIYKTTSNALASTGDGMALAYRAGAPLQDMEFIQFHPTGIYQLGILISEAARGEGGVLRNKNGERFMERYAPTIKDLAPRDMVSRCILEEVRAGRGIDGKDYVHLDLTHLPQKEIGSKLAEIIGFAKTYSGVDATKEPIPVQPTCHYMMGGIAADAAGRVVMDGQGTAFEGLFAAGECACVSVHGANRLGCNSLLDTLVFGRRAGRSMAQYIHSVGWPKVSESNTKAAIRRIEDARRSSGEERIGSIFADLQAVMMDNVSVFREERGLSQTLDVLRALKARYRRTALTDESRRFNRELMDFFELGHMLDLAEAITQGALWREESRGAHFREDYPERNDEKFLVHSMIALNDAGEPQVGTRPVTITRFEPKERTY